MSAEADNQNDWGSRQILLAAMLSQTLSLNTIVIMPQKAVIHGASGHILLYAAIYIFIGIPLLYMEYITGQFTGRNCLDVWKARPYLSHFGYIQILWQIVYVLFTHSLTAFVLHYFLISFEEPIPYYICGRWTNSQCDILYHNYTINQDCLKIKERMPYCSQLYKTFPEYQYWRYYILGLNKAGFYMPWPVTLASWMISVFLFISCFRRTQSVKWVLGICTVFIVCARFLILIGSMLQKGIVVKFEEALDVDFDSFINYIEFPSCVLHVLFSLNIGSGISFNISSRSCFRSPCYSNTVIVVVITGGITILGICSNALMLCPYSFKYGVNPIAIAKYNMLFTYEMVPRLLNVYESRSFWLIMCYSLNTLSFFNVNALIISSLIEIIGSKYSKIAQYPGTITLILLISVFILTIPLLGNKSLYFMLALQRGINFLPVFSVLIECFVFLICYGFDRFSEDVHFMLGVQPKLFVKISWVVSTFVLVYVFCVELYSIFNSRHKSFGSEVGCWLLLGIIFLTVLVTIVKLSKAIYQDRLQEEIGLDRSWGPKSEVIQRSRAMFTTHAMTKEYIYRQYHLQAGILTRQKNCNIRNLTH